MNNTKTTKRALLSSVMAMLICVAMLIGTTFAWFTDSASTGVNKIQAGTLRIGLEKKDATGNWVNAEGQTLSWKKAAGAPTNEQVLWEPGCTYELPLLKITNLGNLETQFKVLINGITGTDKNGQPSTKLLDALNFEVVFLTSEGYFDDPSIVELFTSSFRGSSLNNLPYTIGIPTLITQEDPGLRGIRLRKNGDDGDKFYVRIRAHMDESANNDYQGLSLDNIGITVVATQLPEEYDSFGNQYDKDAEYPSITTGATLNEVFGGANIDFGYGNTSTEAVTLDGKGVAFVSDWTDAWVNSDTTIKGVTFRNGAVFSANTDNVTITLENSTFYACDQSKLTYTGNNSLTNSGAGMCLNLEKSSRQGVKFIVKNCTFVGENDKSLPADGPRYNADGTINGTKKRGHAIALDAICGGGTGTLDSLLIEGCVINGVRGNAIQLYGNTGDITIKDTKINSWAMNSSGVGFAIRGDYPVNGGRTLTIQNVYFGLDEQTGNSDFGHVKVGSFSGNTDGTEMAGTYSK